MQDCRLLTQLDSLPIELGQVVVFGIDNKHRFQGLKSQSIKILEENKFLKMTPNMKIK